MSNVGRWFNNQTEDSYRPFRRRERAMLRCRHMRSLRKFAALHGSTHNRFASPPFVSIRRAPSPLAHFSRNDAPLRSPHGASSVRPDRWRAKATSETFLVGLTAPITGRGWSLQLGCSSRRPRCWLRLVCWLRMRRPEQAVEHRADPPFHAAQHPAKDQ